MLSQALTVCSTIVSLIVNIIKAGPYWPLAAGISLCTMAVAWLFNI